MKKWRRGYTTPSQIASSLNVPTWWIYSAIRQDVIEVLAAWNSIGRNAKAGDIAKATELPRSFVAFVMRRTHGTKKHQIQEAAG